MKDCPIHYLPNRKLTTFCGLQAPGHYISLDTPMDATLEHLKVAERAQKHKYIACDLCVAKHALWELDRLL